MDTKINLKTLRLHAPKACKEIARFGILPFCERNLIDLKEDKDSGLISLQYSITSDMTNEAVKDCRGLVLYADDPTYPVAMSFRKFFNIEELVADCVDFKDADILHKMDGSLLTLYFDHRANIWRVSTTGNPVAGGPYGNERDKTFAKMFWQIFNESKYSLPNIPKCEMDDIWYSFELCDLSNRIVVRYDSPSLVLIGARRRVALQELSHDEYSTHAKYYGWIAVRKINSKDINSMSIKKIAAETNPLELEGFVAVDTNFNRVKIKNPRYVLIHRLKGERTPRAIIDLWKVDGTSEILSYFPEFSDDFNKIESKINLLIEECCNVWSETKNIAVRKDFAEKVKHLPYSGILFDLFTVQQTFEKYTDLLNFVEAKLRNINSNTILRMIGVKD